MCSKRYVNKNDCRHRNSPNRASLVLQALSAHSGQAIIPGQAAVNYRLTNIHHEIQANYHRCSGNQGSPRTFQIRKLTLQRRMPLGHTRSQGHTPQLVSRPELRAQSTHPPSLPILE